MLRLAVRVGVATGLAVLDTTGPFVAALWVAGRLATGGLVAWRLAGAAVLAGMQSRDIVGRRPAQAVHGFGHALLEQGFQAVPRATGALGELAGQGAHGVGGLGYFLFRHLLGLLLHVHAVFDQRLKHLAAFLLGLGKGTQASEPNVVGRIADVVLQCGGIRGVGAGFAGHVFLHSKHGRTVAQLRLGKGRRVSAESTAQRPGFFQRQPLASRGGVALRLFQGAAHKGHQHTQE